MKKNKERGIGIGQVICIYRVGKAKNGQNLQAVRAFIIGLPTD